MTRPRLILLTVLAATVLASSQSQASLSIALVGRVTEVSAPPWSVPGAPVGALINLQLTYDPDTLQAFFFGSVGSESFDMGNQTQVMLVDGRSDEIIAIGAGSYSGEVGMFAGQLNLSDPTGSGLIGREIVDASHFSGTLFIDRFDLPGGFVGEVQSTTFQPLPEPSTVAMIATGFPLGLVFWCWMRRYAA